MLANLYLHWFEHRFHRSDGPGTWAKARLVRYADDFVILARYQSRRLQEWVESTLEGRFQLSINRDKTRVVNLKEPRASLSFLGFTFRYDRDLKGRDRRYLNVFPSDKSLARVRTKRDRCNRRILCRVITWRRGLSGIHQNGAGCGDGEITRCGEGEVLAGGDSAAGSQWPGNEAVLCPGGDFRTPVLLVATNPASARSAPSPSVGGRRGGGLGP